MTDARDQRVLRMAPDIVVETLSPKQKADEFANKMAFYLANGVRLVRVVNPDRETITAYEPGNDILVLRPDDTLAGSDVLPGFTASLADIFEQLVSRTGTARVSAAVLCLPVETSVPHGNGNRPLRAGRIPYSVLGDATCAKGSGRLHRSAWVCEMLDLEGHRLVTANGKRVPDDMLRADRQR